jgi:hypothetical protein
MEEMVQKQREYRQFNELNQKHNLLGMSAADPIVALVCLLTPLL